MTEFRFCLIIVANYALIIQVWLGFTESALRMLQDENTALRYLGRNGGAEKNAEPLKCGHLLVISAMAKWLFYLNWFNLISCKWPQSSVMGDARNSTVVVKQGYYCIWKKTATQICKYDDKQTLLLLYSVKARRQFQTRSRIASVCVCMHAYVHVYIRAHVRVPATLCQFLST